MKIFRHDKNGLFAGELEAKEDLMENERGKRLYAAELAIINRMEGLDDNEKAGLVAKLKTPKKSFLIPANATTKAPPSTSGNMVAVFTGEKWNKVEDRRGQVFHFPEDRSEFTMETIGPLPEGAITGKRPISDEEKWESIRYKRNSLLVSSDWMVLPDSPMSDDPSVAIAYRQELRDIPQKFSDPEKVVFPEMV